MKSVSWWKMSCKCTIQVFECVYSNEISKTESPSNTGISWSVTTSATTSSALEVCSADGRSPTGRLFRPNALSALNPRLRWLPAAFFFTHTDWSRAACYHGDHFIQNTGKEEGCQWCKVQEHRETAGEKNVTFRVSHKTIRFVVDYCYTDQRSAQGLIW